MPKKRVKRGQLEMSFRTHGGKRRGSGRKPRRGQPGPPHDARPEHDRRYPVHVTLRVIGNIGGMRCRDIYLTLREATIVTAKREDFRIVHMSIQRDHIHMLVEADHKAALSKGIHGFSISAARQILGAGKTGRLRHSDPRRRTALRSAYSPLDSAKLPD